MFSEWPWIKNFFWRCSKFDLICPHMPEHNLWGTLADLKTTVFVKPAPTAFLNYALTRFDEAWNMTFFTFNTAVFELRWPRMTSELIFGLISIDSLTTFVGVCSDIFLNLHGFDTSKVNFQFLFFRPLKTSFEASKNL